MPLFVSKRYLSLLEKEVAYWREKADQERDRADRLHDALLTQCGQLPVTEVVRQEVSERRSAQESAQDRHQNELQEMFAESLEEGGVELPPDLQADAAQMIGEKNGAAR